MPGTTSHQTDIPTTQGATAKFYLNGKIVVIPNADPVIPLANTIRERAGLKGTKVACGQGNCGACTVLVTYPYSPDPVCVNSCLFPTGALLVGDNFPDERLLRIETVEGASADPSSLQALAAKAIAECNGSQCGFCTCGMVMKAAYHVSNSKVSKKNTVRDIEDLLDGNLCRCTGYRPILYALKSQFAPNDPKVEAEAKETPPCVPRGKDGLYAENYSTGRLQHKNVTMPKPEEHYHYPPDQKTVAVARPPEALRATGAPPMKEAPTQEKKETHGHAYASPVGGSGTWYAPTTTTEVLSILETHRNKARLVAGNVNNAFIRLFNLPDDTVFIATKGVTDLQPKIVVTDGTAILGGCTSITDMIDFIDSLKGDSKYDVDSLSEHMHSIANIQVRNLGTVVGNLVGVQHRNGILHSDIGLVLSSLDGKLVIQAEHHITQITVYDFLTKANPIPPEFEGRWMITSVYFTPPLRGQTASRYARTSPRAYGNFPTLCSIAYTYTQGQPKAQLHFTGPHTAENVIMYLVTVDYDANMTNMLKQASAQIKANPDLHDDDKRLATQMCARVLCIDGNPEKQIQAVSMTEERKEQGQAGSQHFYVNPKEAPVTEPMVKEASYEHVHGEAHYPFDHEISAGGFNGSPVLIPTSVTTFDAGLLKQAGNNLLQAIDPTAIVLTAMDIPYEEGEAVIPHTTGGDNRMFTHRNVLVEDSQYTAGELGPGSFGEFIAAPGMTTYAGQVIALVLHQDETTSRKLAFTFQGAIDHIFGLNTTGPVLSPNPNFVDQTSSKGVMNIEASKAKNLHLVDPSVHASGDTSKWVDAQGKLKYDAMWADYKREGGADPAHFAYVESTAPILTGFQQHVYMEPQTALASKEEDRYHIHASTQSASSTAEKISPLLGTIPRDVIVTNKRIGGGFGGKTNPSKLVAGLAALGLVATGRTCRVSFDRQVDFQIIGKRHAFEGHYKVAVNTETGRIKAMELIYDGDAGCSSDVSPLVLARANISAMNMYDMPEFRCTSTPWLTHKSSSTAMRAFGVMQGVSITETAIDHALAQLNVNRKAAGFDEMAPHDFRSINFYRENPGAPIPQRFPRVPYALTYTPEHVPVAFNTWGQQLFQTDILVDQHRGAWTAATGPEFQRCVAEMEEYNASHQYRKRGIGLIPILYGAGFEVSFLNQNVASVSVYWGGGAGTKWGTSHSKGEGFVLINQAAVEMGQGVFIGLQASAAAALNIPAGLVKIGTAGTDTVPNSQGTGASTGSELNAPAIIDAAHKLRLGFELMNDKNVSEIVKSRVGRGLLPSECLSAYDPNVGYAVSGNIDKPTSQWTQIQESFKSTPVTQADMSTQFYHDSLTSVSDLQHLTYYVANFRTWKVPQPLAPAPSLDLGALTQYWKAVVNLAFKQRIPTMASGIGRPCADAHMTMNTQNWFSYFTYGCGWSYVEVDSISGEMDILRTDILYDCGGSRNPAIDVGQIEGAVLQGVGNLMTEECTFDEKTGRLNQPSIMAYAIPAHRTVPRNLNTKLFWLPGSETDSAGAPLPPIDHRADPERAQAVDFKTANRAKTTGEPPLVLSVSVLMAARNAVLALRHGIRHTNESFVPLNTPLTPKAMLQAIWDNEDITDYV